MSKANDLDKQIKDLEFQKGRLETNGTEMQGKIERLLIDLQEKNENIRYSNEQLEGAQKEINHMDEVIKGLEAQNDKNKNESLYHQQKLQNETGKTSDLTNKLVECEGYMQELENQFENTKNELKRCQNEGKENIYELSKEIDNNKRTIEVLLIQNKELLEELEKFSSEDDQVRIILNRKSRISDIKNKQLNEIAMNPPLASSIRESKSSPLKMK